MRDLLGGNLLDLYTFQNGFKIRNWINMQTQEDLNMLGLGLTTTRVDSTQAPLKSNSSVSSGTASVTQGQYPHFQYFPPFKVDILSTAHEAKM